MKKAIAVYILLSTTQLISSCCGDGGPSDDTIFEASISHNPYTESISYLHLTLTIDLKNMHDVTYTSLPGFNGALACSPGSTYNLLKDWRITSNKPFANQNAGADLKDYFRFQDLDEYPNDDYITWLPTYEDLKLVITETPGQRDDYTFTVEMDLDDGRTIVVQTDPITITP